MACGGNVDKYYQLLRVNIVVPMIERPKGLTAVAILTLLSAAGHVFFAIILTGLSAVGGPPPSGYRPSPLIYLLIYTPYLFSLLSALVALGILNGDQYGWPLSVILWITSSAYHCYVAISAFRGVSLILALNLITVLTNIFFILYFQTKTIKNYFLKAQRTASNN